MINNKNSNGSNNKNDELEPRQDTDHADVPMDTEQRKEDSEFAENLGSVPEGIRREVTQISRTMGMIGSSSFHPLYDKFTDKHIDKFLDYSYQEEFNSYSLHASNRWFYLIYVGMALAFLVFIIVYLAPQHKDILIDILKIIMAFAGGFGVGFGWKRSSERKQ